MITLDQVYLLEQKVESAVEKIQQLQAENDALRKKCSELTNALSSKSEQLTSFESDQNQIENGIKKALERLNAIENSVLKTVQAAPSTKNTNTNIESKKEEIEEDYNNPAMGAINFQSMSNLEKNLSDNVKKENNSLNKSEEVTINFQKEKKDNPFNQVSEVEKELSETINNTNPFSINSENKSQDSLNENFEEENDNSDELGFDIF
ncbi:MAG: cell division protein ZapB [Treponema sp.]|nr:cell division protein ZapB [Treponema sp.]